jgi:hypothetical protein
MLGDAWRARARERERERERGSIDTKTSRSTLVPACLAFARETIVTAAGFFAEQAKHEFEAIKGKERGGQGGRADFKGAKDFEALRSARQRLHSTFLDPPRSGEGVASMKRPRENSRLARAREKLS